MFDFLKRLLGFGMPCILNTLTGLYCPGCGGTRAVISLLHGNLLKSIQYHPLVLYTVAVGVLEAVSWGISKFTDRPGPLAGKFRLFTLGAVAVVVGNCIFKNYILVFRGVDLLPPL